MGINMGIHPLLAKGGDKRKFRWMFTIEPYIGDSVSMLPPHKSARPNISFKEYQVEHLNETIYFPGKVEWQTMEVSLYDIKCEDSPIYEWLKMVYNPEPNEEDEEDSGFYGPSLSDELGGDQYKTTATLVMLNGCGDEIEKWVYENAYPNKIDWGEVDMSNSEVVTVDLTLRFDRAYRVVVSKPKPPGNFVGPSF